MRVLISTSAVQPWTVLQQGCTKNDPQACGDHRGGVFNPNKSSTWQEQGLYTLQSQQNLGIFANGDFGYDTINLGIPGSANIKADKQIVAGIAAKNFYVATWGIRPAPTNLTNINDPIPSLLQSLRDQGSIPSLSWGYTAGAYYQSLQGKGALGSLTLGGYDTARFTNSSTSYPFGPDTSRDLLVGIQSITFSDGNKSLLPTPHLTFVDSGVPHLWLPEDACNAFQSAFGLLWSSTLELYFVNSTQHDALKKKNPSVTLTLGSDLTSNTDLVNIMPYSAFDLRLNSDYPGISNDTAYFPLRRAANNTQYTLGRAFLQNAYVIADYERSTFSIHPAVFPDNPNAQKLQAIPSLADSSSSTLSSSSQQSAPALTTGAVVGIAIGSLLALFLIAGALFGWRYWRQRQAGRQRLSSTSNSPDKKSHPPEELAAPDAGLAGVYVGELESKEKSGELVGSELEMGEMQPQVTYRLKAELAGSDPQLVSPTTPRVGYGEVKSLNREAAELP